MQLKTTQEDRAIFKRSIPSKPSKSDFHRIYFEFLNKNAEINLSANHGSIAMLIKNSAVKLK